MPEAQFQYALLLLDGRFVKKDPQGAYALMQAAAEAGNRLAQFNFAQLLIDREPAQRRHGPRRSPTIERAADGGLADAQYAMAQVYANGVGGKKRDDAEARRWLLLAARQNFDTAQVDLGTWLVEGRGGKRDLKAGFGWLKRAARGRQCRRAEPARQALYGRHRHGAECHRRGGLVFPRPPRRAAPIPRWKISCDGLTEEEQKQALGAGEPAAVD